MPQSIIKRYRIPVALSSWITFAISLTLYWITADPGVSYWDCAEYVAVASRLEVGHPPGNPVWMLAMRVATIPFPVEYHAYIINLCSGLFMAFASFFLCRIIAVATLLYFDRKYKNADKSSLIYRLIPAAIATGASLCFALCDSAWFSAVEAEVYAMSAFLTALSLWIMTLWWFETSHPRQTGLLILLAYLTGLSLGVHQLNLLLIPVFSLIILYKKNPGWINPVILWLVVIASIGVIGVILLAFIPGVLFGAESFELWSVNTLGLPYHSGILIYLSLLLILLLIGLTLTSKFRFHKINTILWSVAFLLLGFSSFGVILIRGAASPFMNEGTPGNIFGLTSYINREQYPKVPLFYGQTPNSRAMFEETYINGQPQYTRYLLEKGKGIYQPYLEGAELNYRSGMVTHEDSSDNRRVIAQGRGYLLTDYKFRQKLTPELNMWFPRITSLDAGDLTAYRDWGGMTPDKMDRIAISETVDSAGHFQPKADDRGNRPSVYSYRPTYYQNLQYFVAYQAYYMYFRYLFWNFIGRQNDFPSNGEIEHGNFVTGIPLIDDALIGDTDSYPAEIWRDNPGRNIYFGLPFLLGILGIVFLASGRRWERRYLTLISLFFLMTGLAIVVYLNQSPGEPRERDYTFLGSYMAFAMWIGAGMTAVAHALLHSGLKKISVTMAILLSLGVPALMAVENFDDHDRRGRFETAFYASSLLDFEKPAIIFSQGDNSTFPLWYAAEVEGKGEEHTVVDLTYLSLPTYVTNLRKQGERGLKLTGKTAELEFGKYLFTKIPHDSVSEPVGIKRAIEELYEWGNGMPEWISSRLIIPNGKDSVTINLHDFTHGGSLLSFKHLMLLDMIASYDTSRKVLFFPYMTEHSFRRPLAGVLKPVLFGEVYAPDITEGEAMQLLKESVARELDKLEVLSPEPHYADPVTSDRSVRYRGEMVLAGKEILKSGNVELPVRIVESIETYYPYASLLPGNFTIADSTYYEGMEYLNLLDELYEITGEEKLKQLSERLETEMSERRDAWLEYYQSLNPWQRKTLSNRSKRNLINKREE